MPVPAIVCLVRCPTDCMLARPYHEYLAAPLWKKMHRTTLGLMAAFLASATFTQTSIAATGTLFSVDAVNAIGLLSPVLARTKGASVLRAQILLARAHFSSGEIDGAFGSNLFQAISGYQRKNALDVTGTVNTATWAALNADNAKALIPYTITEADVAGPFNPVPKGMDEKSKMLALGFASADELLGEKFHVSPALLKRLNPGKNLALAGQEIIVPNVLDTGPLPKAGKIIVDQSSRTLTVLDTDGKTIAQFPSTSGSKHDPLPYGHWKVKGVAANPVFQFNPQLFWDAKPEEKKAKIPAGPNNPVGVAWIDLTKEHYGIHGTPVPSTIGKTESHGCIRLTNWDVKLLSSIVSTGTQVALQK